MKFDWDLKKAETNRIKHGIRFEDAIQVFDDPFALRSLDDMHSDLEKRHWLLGSMEADRVVVVVFTERQEGIVNRIISARWANRKERTQYEENKRISF